MTVKDHDEAFVQVGLQRWGRAQGVLDAFERRLGEELIRIGIAHASALRMGQVKPGRPKVEGRGRDKPVLRVEFAGTFRGKPAELVLGVQWVGQELAPEYYAGLYDPPSLRELGEAPLALARELGVKVEREAGRDWVVAPAASSSLEEGFDLLLRVLLKKVEGA